jgi:hypothetical protein
MLMRETVACGRLKREDLSAVGWKAVPSVAEEGVLEVGAAAGKLQC